MAFAQKGYQQAQAYAPVFAEDEQVGVALNNLKLLAEFDNLDSTNTRSFLTDLPKCPSSFIPHKISIFT